jgi:hypothetical protein
MRPEFCSTQRGPAGANLFIYGIPDYFHEHDVFSMFSPFGTIVSVTVHRNDLGIGKGYAFVSYSSVQAADCARHGTNGCYLRGKRVSVTIKARDYEFYNGNSADNLHLRAIGGSAGAAADPHEMLVPVPVQEPALIPTSELEHDDAAATDDAGDDVGSDADFTTQ